MPHEISLFGVFFSPWLGACAAACVLSALTAWLFNLSGAKRSFHLRQWVFLAVLILYTGLLYLWSV